MICGFIQIFVGIHQEHLGEDMFFFPMVDLDFRVYVLPSLKLTWHLKIDGWKMQFPFGKDLFFRCELLISGEGKVLGGGFIQILLLELFTPKMLGMNIRFRRANIVTMGGSTTN